MEGPPGNNRKTVTDQTSRTHHNLHLRLGSHLCGDQRQADWTDDLAKVHPLRQPQQGNVVVVVVGLKVWVKDNLVHGAAS